jgi:hypothetical protein
MSIKLNGATSGSVELDVPDSVGSDLSITIPATAGDIVVKGTDGSVDLGAIDIDSSGRLLVGTSSAGTGAFASSLFAVQGVAGFPNVAGFMNLQRGEAASSITANEELGVISFTDNDANAFAKIQGVADGTAGSGDYPGRLAFSTTTDGASSPTERMRIHNNGLLTAPGVYSFTTASAANVFVAPSGNLQRSTSSIKYKIDVETLQDSYADVLLTCRPVWYRSTCAGDNPAHSWWGFIAEEVAQIDPRLVFWKTTESVVQEDGTRVSQPCDPEPEGVQYDRFVPHLLNLIKRQKEQIETQSTAIAALETRLTALEGGAE